MTSNADRTEAIFNNGEKVQMKNQLAICKFTLKRQVNTSEANLNANTLKVDAGAKTYNVTLASASNYCFVALQPYTGEVTFTATNTTGTHVEYTNPKTFVPADVTLDDLGKVLLPEGKIYEANHFYDETLTLKDQYNNVALIAYVGSDTGEDAYGYTHGLAIAMKDAPNPYRDNNQKDFTSRWKEYGYDNNVDNEIQITNLGNQEERKAALSSVKESGLQYRVARMDEASKSKYPAFYAAANFDVTIPTNGCSGWFLCSAYQWNLIIDNMKNMPVNGSVMNFNHCCPRKSVNILAKALYPLSFSEVIPLGGLEMTTFAVTYIL